MPREEELFYLNSRGQLVKVSKETFERIQVTNADIVKAIDFARAEQKRNRLNADYS